MRLVWVVIPLVILSIVVFIGFSQENFSSNYISEFQLNQTDIHYVDTHVESINGYHYATINKTEIIDENKIKITFRDNNYSIHASSKLIYKVPSFEFTKIVEKDDKFIVTCLEWKNVGSKTINILHLTDITNDTVIFHHYGSPIQPTSECKYPDVIQDSFDFDWKFTDVMDSEIKNVQYTSSKTSESSLTSP